MMGNIKILGERIHREADVLWKNFVYFVESFPENGSASKINTDARNEAPLQEAITRINVGPSEKPYWEETGWWKQGNVYTGRYLTRYGVWDGRIVDQAGMFTIFISKPPIGRLKRHPHGQCFVKAGPGTGYQIHLHKSPLDVSSAIIQVQGLLEEAFTL
jgi:hypothetical protein